MARVRGMMRRGWLAAVTLQALFTMSSALAPPRALIANTNAGHWRPWPGPPPIVRAASRDGGGKDGGEPPPPSPFDAAKMLEQAAEQAKGSIELVVRATGNDQYQFG